MDEDTGVRRAGALRRLRERLEEGPPGGDAAFFAAIAAQITARRVELGVSQAQLAELCGTTQSAIARLERGERPPRIDTLLRIAGALDCELQVRLRSRTRRRGSTS